ncbi:glycosyl hydrolase family 76-domain-containing protein [Copromyces sp. CBS 386.78]|nr:glycosyl hydrolase family 76-domain-containing protein [Copromyces sp. CBS 386.78]
MRTIAITALLVVAHQAWAALQVDLNSPESIKRAASLVASDLLTYYHGSEPGQTPGILPGPPPAGDYYWWESGALWGTLMDYWHYTGDSTYNELITSSMLFHTGPPLNAYMPENYTISMGNDDQGFWGLSAMLAAETGFPDPPADEPQWLQLAQAVFHTQADPGRHDTVCGGGLRWQIPMSNIGYDYKNSISNGIFFNLGARLARYTGNETYAHHARKTWDWMMAVGLMTEDGDVYDGAHTGVNCTDVFKAQFSYNAAIFLQGAAFMYSFTTGEEQSLWAHRVQALLDRTTSFFFRIGPIIELSCETPAAIICKTDMLSFKGYTHRWMASTAQLAPFTRDTIMRVLRNSTVAAVNSCRGPLHNGRACGFRWTTGGYDGLTGAGQEMNVLAALSSLLAFHEEEGLDGKTGKGAPLTGETGGTSKGDPHAGTGKGGVDPTQLGEVTTGDRVGAWVLTVFTLGTIVAAFVLMGTGRFEDREGMAAAVENNQEKKKELSIWYKIAREVIFRHQG